ncbi:hypothetical protein SAZ11_22560 [Streptomyces sp. FXJ1.4098]|nr:hypothetical protein [Streptomyces sp. FXJ1.4098]
MTTHDQSTAVDPRKNTPVIRSSAQQQVAVGVEADGGLDLLLAAAM